MKTATFADAYIIDLFVILQLLNVQEKMQYLFMVFGKKKNITCAPYFSKRPHTHSFVSKFMNPQRMR